METPVLSKLQKKLSLTGKKKKKEIIKNVVVDPHKTNWPLVQNELETLSESMKKNLPRVKPVKINVPWRLLKDVPKDERKNIRNEYLLKHRRSEEVIKDDNIIFGVNGVTKLLESASCSAVLVADVIPRTVVKHIVEMAVLQNIPVLVVSTLKQMLKDFCGLESMAVAIKKDCKSNLANIVEIISEISKNYPPVDNHINSTRSEILEEKEEQKFNLNKHVEKRNSNVTKMEELVRNANEQQIVNYHLDAKTSSNERVFVPEMTENQSNLPAKILNNNDEFQDSLPITTNKSHQDMAHEAIRKKIKKKLYKSLTVKRLKGNKNREKEKNKLHKIKK